MLRLQNKCTSYICSSFSGYFLLRPLVLPDKPLLIVEATSKTFDDKLERTGISKFFCACTHKSCWIPVQLFKLPKTILFRCFPNSYHNSTTLTLRNDSRLLFFFLGANIWSYSSAYSRSRLLGFLRRFFSDSATEKKERKLQKASPEKLTF